MNETRKKSKASAVFAYVVIGFFLTLIFGTLAGVWIKVFWLGWVLP